VYSNSFGAPHRPPHCLFSIGALSWENDINIEDSNGENDRDCDDRDDETN